MNRRRRGLSYFCAGFVLIALSGGPSWPADAPSAQALLLATDFAPVSRVEDIAAPVMTIVTKALEGLPLADPPYLTKTGAGSTTRGPQLLFAGRAASVWFVHYKVGPDAPVYHLLVLTMDAESGAHLAGHLILKERAWSVPNMKNIVRRGDFSVAK